MSNSKELVLFLPGMGVKEPEAYLEKLLAGLSSYCNGKGIPFRKVEDSSTEGTGQRRIEVALSSESHKTIDIQEMYWGDLLPAFSSESISRKVVRGLSLLAFWTTSADTWKRAVQSKYMMFNTVFTLLVILCWYYGALVAMFTAVGANPDFLDINIPESVAGRFKILGNDMGGWYVWGAASLVMGVLPVAEIIDISYATKCYLQNRRGMFHKVCGRIGKTIAGAGRSRQNYERITVLGHSFGAVVSTEILANYSGAQKIRFITLGGPLLLITARSERVKKALEKVIDNQNVESWTDFYSVNDWLCTYSPVSKDIDKFRSMPITSTVPLDEKIKGASHDLYFDDWDVMEAILHH